MKDQLNLGIQKEPEAPAPREVCGIDGPNILHCDALLSVLMLGKSWLYTGEMVELRGPGVRYAVILDFGKRGHAVLKFCPFCGAELKTVLTNRATMRKRS